MTTPEKVKCGGCEHLFHDDIKRTQLSLLSCRVKQTTAEERATYMGVAWEHECAKYLVRRTGTRDPRVDAEAQEARLLTERTAFLAQPKGRRESLPVATTPAVVANSTKATPEVRSNSPFDLGARPVPSSPTVARDFDPFDFEAA